VVRSAVRGPSPARFDLDLAHLRQVPRSPFAYWVGDAVRVVFRNPKVLSFDAKCGMGTLDDFRFLRLDWEVSPAGRRLTWQQFAKGGAFGPYFADVHLVVRWTANGTELKTFVEAKVGSASRKIQATSY